MSTQILITKLTGRPVAAPCSLGMPMAASGLLLADALLPVLATGARSERPTEASAVAAAAKTKAHAFGFAAAAANGAGNRNAAGAEGAYGSANGQQKTQQYGKWAFRGLEPWSDPA
ncbi:hypothetical protein [Actinacidiphila epipremni]|jgi:hypothetical protein|uniref:Uncharacterized protein n=1 Tax=Actinacidiphila epipremni TaxID=2053013 RepID=A0ABX0ZIY0_9ACTN|nr:hypothetical protein [Actinacidiphila epipremni]NJP42417.1 hypothetical protein [Actinacidiphila epipremni]